MQGWAGQQEAGEGSGGKAEDGAGSGLGAVRLNGAGAGSVRLEGALLAKAAVAYNLAEAGRLGERAQVAGG